MIFIVIAAICYAIAVLFLTVASRHINTNLSVGVVNLVSAIVPLILAASAFSKKSFGSQKLGLLMAVLGGIFIGIFGMALSKSYSVSKVAIVTPLVFGGMIVISAILSLIFLKEKITALQVVGLAIIMVGLSTIVYAKASGK